MKLNATTVAQFKSIKTPQYDRTKLKSGILHIGLGNFHRAHQAWYLDRLFSKNRDLNWAIVGAGVRPYDAARRKLFLEQDCLSTLIELEPGNNCAHVLGSMIDYIEVADDHAPLISALSQEQIRIVSLTVTEGGYYINPASGHFDSEHPDIKHDAKYQDQPKSFVGAIMAALRARRRANKPPLTVMSCDNLPHNGDVARDALLGLAHAQGGDMVNWISDKVTFPNSMVDCITPATTKREIQRAIDFGVEDALPVACEPFRQWVLEDDFPYGRPALEDVGATFTKHVDKFELMKLRILNGGHAAIAYPAGLLEIMYVHEAMAHPLIRAFLDKLEYDEIIPSVPPVPNTNLKAYYDIIAKRFSNHDLQDTISRLCLNGSDRQPKFILPGTLQRLREGSSIEGLSLVSALWCRYCAAQSEHNTPIVIEDESASRLTEYAKRAKKNPLAFLEMEEIFGEVGTHPRFRKSFSDHLARLWNDGVINVLKNYIAS